MSNSWFSTFDQQPNSPGFESMGFEVFDQQPEAVFDSMGFQTSISSNNYGVENVNEELYRSIGLDQFQPAEQPREQWHENDSFHTSNKHFQDPWETFQPQKTTDNSWQSFQQAQASEPSFGARAPVPKSVPDFLSPNTTLVSTETYSKLWEVVQSCLTIEKIDFEANNSKYKIKSASYTTAKPTNFKIRFYRGQSDETIIEFQRLGGCVVDFMNLFRAICTDIGMSSCSLYAKGSNSRPLPAPLPMLAFPTLPPIVVSDEEVASIVYCLVEVAMSGPVDQQWEAMEELSMVSKQANFQLHPELLSLLSKLLGGADSRLATSAAAVVANAAAQIDHDQCSLLLSPLCQGLNNIGGLCNVDTKRCLSEALANLATRFGQGAEWRTHINTFDRFSSAADPTLRDNIQRTLQSVSIY